MFQSLKGILVNFNENLHLLQRTALEFQSLKGILVNFNLITCPVENIRAGVSIPQRDFGEFQRFGYNQNLFLLVFQSLKGILVNFNLFPH
ncbi:Epoxyqueuosine (oQ) reductase QueG [Geitlerinema sp. FC II]|nr:Epoxyqueuosine (oQ) reductase QueG [Geitlerinema sp. FC II]